MSFGRLISFAMVVMTLGLVTGCQTQKAKDYAPMVARFYLETKSGEPGLALRLPVSEVSIAVNPKPVLVEYDIVNAEVARVELGECLLLQMTPAAARDLYRLSVVNIGRRLVLVLNDSSVGVHLIERPLADGVVLVFVEAADSELPVLVERLKLTAADIATTAAKNR